MKIYLLLLFLLLNPFILFSKTTNSQHTLPSIFAIVYSIGSVASVRGGAPQHSVPTLWINLEWNIPINIKKYYIYTQFRSSFFISNPADPFSNLLPIIHMENFKLGFLFGFGGLVADWRTDNNTGSYITVNGGFVFEGSYYSRSLSSKFIPISSSLLESFYHIGFEINSRYHFILDKHQILSFGLTVGYFFNPIAGDPFYLGLQKEIVFFHMLNYNFSIGLHF
ncbi:MAG: hypothetical protein KFW21_05665 [Spirochaetota bacterium]|nr:hypothetical protein [Spirochaetota bacterium]